MTFWALAGVLDLAVVPPRSLEDIRDPGVAILGLGLLDLEDTGLLFWEGPGHFDLELLKDMINPSLQSSACKLNP